MTVLLIAGSPSEKSRSAALLEGVQQRLHQRGAHVERLQIRDLSPQALILADFSHRTISHAIRRVANAEVVVVATPVYKAACLATGLQFALPAGAGVGESRPAVGRHPADLPGAGRCAGRL